MSFGEELRRERELRQISLREIARVTKIDLRHLEAMERNDFACLPEGLYRRGYIRAYCEHIGVDSEAMVNAYLLEEQAQRAGSPDDGGDRLLRGRSGSRSRVDALAREIETEGLKERRQRLIWLALGLLVLALLVAGALLVARVLLGGSSARGAVDDAARPVPRIARLEPGGGGR